MAVDKVAVTFMIVPFLVVKPSLAHRQYAGLVAYYDTERDFYRKGFRQVSVMGKLELFHAGEIRQLGKVKGGK